MSKSLAFCGDCMDILPKYPDKYFDLAVVDPPYGTQIGAVKFSRMGGHTRKKYGKKALEWDVAPGEEYFQELFRVSKNQIIWGGNFFQLPITRCFLVWEKTQIPENFSMAMVEYAWCSFNDNAKIFKASSVNKNRFHPTQKPEALYRWIYQKYTKPGDKIIDTHLGSGSSRRAAYDFDLDFTGIEIDKDYFEQQEKEFSVYTSQRRIGDIYT